MAAGLSLALIPAMGLAPAVFAQDNPASTATGYVVGYDISWPQCGGAYPANPAFGIVGVNKGIVFSVNPCLASQISWGGGARAGLYANTGNPGPALSTHWPLGQQTPQFCDPAVPDSAACAHDYGYNAAADSYADAVSAFTALGIAESPAASAWWLDVETGNSWRSDVTLNVAALSGEVEYLRSVGVASIGFYSTQYQWNVITGGTSTFAAYKSWVAGASDEQGAAANCGLVGFTGGGVALAQFPLGGFDGNVSCATEAPVLTSIRVDPTSASVQAGQSQLFSAIAYDQFGRAMSPQPTFGWTVSGGGAISSSGVFTAGSTGGGPFTVTASSGTVSGTASVSVTTVSPDFALSVSPASQSVKRGRTAAFNVTIAGQSGFTGSVSLSVSGQPAGSTVTFTPNPGTTTSTLSIKPSASGPRGTFTLTITGTSGARTHIATATLTVTK